MRAVLDTGVVDQNVDLAKFARGKLHHGFDLAGLLMSAP
jgi:hypothetical protein